VDISTYTRKDIGNLGERIGIAYFRRHGFEIIAQNIAFKTGELDIIALKSSIMHVVEVKTSTCEEFPSTNIKDKLEDGEYNPAYNLHSTKIRKVIKTAQWYVAQIHWEGEWQVDALLVWIRRRDGIARVHYIAQVL
jgi:Holliday junction resolvase-like predicted endonuclease